LARLAQELRPDAVILALPPDQAIHDALFHALFDCRVLGIRVTAMASLYEHITGRVAVEYGGPQPVVVMSAFPPHSRRLYRLVKRGFDIAVALIGCMLAAILAPLIWLANRVTAPGDLFDRQKCRKAGGQCFQLVTFRTRAVNADQRTGGGRAKENGRRVTPMGRILRKTRLDALPQFWNVLRGEMSLVGPRPVVVAQLPPEIPFQRVRYAVKPGITGWAQVKYADGAAPRDALGELQYDLYYIKHQGVYLDLLILLKTVPAVWQQRHRDP